MDLIFIKKMILYAIDNNEKVLKRRLQLTTSRLQSLLTTYRWQDRIRAMVGFPLSSMIMPTEDSLMKKSASRSSPRLPPFPFLILPAFILDVSATMT